MKRSAFQDKSYNVSRIIRGAYDQALGTKIPSTPTESLHFGVLYGGVDLTIFEEPVRVEGVRVRIIRLVAEHRPSQHSASRPKKGVYEMGMTYHTFFMTVVPAGMNCPWYTSSSITRCAPPEARSTPSAYNKIYGGGTVLSGVGGLHRKTSFTKAEVYGNSGLSESSGKRSPPTTSSNSF